jgi:lipopolysaccharide export system permease protein
MKVLTRYLLRTHLGPFFFAFLALTSVLLINVIAKELANLAGKGLPLDIALEYFVLSLPANIALTLPMAVLVAVLYTFSTLASENEISALRASGVDLRQATMPLVLLAALIAGGMAWFNDQVLPASNYRWRVLMGDVAAARPLLVIQSQALNAITTDDGLTRYYLEAREVEAETGRLRDVTIYDVANPNLTRTINADSGRMALNQQQTDMLLTLFDGRIREVDFAEPQNFQLIEFEQQIMRIEGVSDRIQRNFGSEYRTDRDMTSAMMLAAIDSLRAERDQLLSMAAGTTSQSPTDIGEATPDSSELDEQPAVDPTISVETAMETATEPIATGRAGQETPGETSAPVQEVSPLGEVSEVLEDAVTATATPEEIAEAEAAANSVAVSPPAEPDRFITARVENIEYQIREYQLEIHKKFSIAGATLVFVLLGIPLALRFPRGGIGMVVAVSLAIFGIYYVGLIGGEEFGDRGYVPPGVAMWTTNFVFGVLGLIGFYRLGREQGTGRGSGWGEMPRLPNWMRRRRVAAVGREEGQR